MSISGRVLTLAAVLMLLAIPVQEVRAGTAAEINLKVDEALARFKKESAVAESVLAASKGVLVFPNVIKAGIGIGGEFGEGALRIGGETVEYYTTAAASIGFQLGAQSKAVFLVFMQAEALENFRASSGWKAGVDGSVALINIGAGASFDTTQIEEPIVGFVMTNAGLMYNATLEGSKYTKVVR
jgi:lipid-binding SYLF domain-containing protein